MTKVFTVGKIITLLEKWVPKKYAYEWDNVGLQVGDLTTQVTKILVTLDITEDVVDEAIAQGANLIIAHHPLLFKPIKQINVNSVQGRILRKLILHEITAYAAHTNLDIVEGGVNDLLAERLNLQSARVMIPEFNEKLYKFHVYVPETHLDLVDHALTRMGVGQIGDYKDCSFRVKGTGAFTPLKQADPYIGEQGNKSYVEEIKLEYMLKEAQLQEAIRILLATHPYEEPAYDLIELENEGKVEGLGRIGELIKATTLADFANEVKEIFSLSGLRVTGSLDKKIKRVAVLGGSGEKYFKQAKRLGADVYVTGDLTFHQAQDAEALGLAIIDPGHHIESVMIGAVCHYLKQKLNQEATELEVIPTQLSSDPFKFI
ncbi:Nif3-like dinuclear metal center hexameric protein [Amphibacillus jilinensis]|uniref:Nif3-like dinuclear metal center hexameric protein n=1 Tax=Amphibacillus jilinensis TaxID=1216008 RepID=UPI0002E6F304|nr:Nif3-like dinuclear metal center hexameric protein [Amphibacillus jilinensis]